MLALALPHIECLFIQQLDILMGLTDSLPCFCRSARLVRALHTRDHWNTAPGGSVSASSTVKRAFCVTKAGSLFLIGPRALAGATREPPQLTAVCRVRGYLTQPGNRKCFVPPYCVSVLPSLFESPPRPGVQERDSEKMAAH